MKKYKTFSAAFLVLAGTSFVSLPVFAAPAPLVTTVEVSVIQQAGSLVNWEAPTGNDIQAVGIGLPPVNAGVRAPALARRAAIVDAYRYLAESINGIQLTAETTVQDLMVQNDTVKTKVEAVLNGVKIIGEGTNPDGSYWVRVSVPLYGVQGIAGSTLSEVPPPVDANSFIQLPASTPTIGGGYTGVIVDASGMGLEPTFSPAIYDVNGRGIYGTTNVDSKVAIANGMVQYSKNLNAAIQNSRAGANPLVIRAQGVKGGAAAGRSVHVVVSPEDAEKILAANAQSGILNGCKVVFVR